MLEYNQVGMDHHAGIQTDRHGSFHAGIQTGKHGSFHAGIQTDHALSSQHSHSRQRCLQQCLYFSLHSAEDNSNFVKFKHKYSETSLVGVVQSI